MTETKNNPKKTSLEVCMANDQLLSLLWYVRQSVFPEDELPATPGLLRDKQEQKFWWLLYVIDLKIYPIRTGCSWKFTRYGPYDTSDLRYRLQRVFLGEPAMKIGVKPLLKVLPIFTIEAIDVILEMWSAFWDYKEFWQVFEMEYPELYETVVHIKNLPVLPT